MSVIDDYINRLDQPQKTELERVRRVISGAAPDAVEAISYGMPAFKYKDKYLIAFAAFKNHYSVFPGAHAIQAHLVKLSKHKVSKGTVQYTPENPLSDTTLANLIATRMDDINRA